MRVRPRVQSLHTRGLRPQSRERWRAAHTQRRLQILGLNETLPLGHHLGRQRVVIDAIPGVRNVAKLTSIRAPPRHGALGLDDSRLGETRIHPQRRSCCC